MDLKEYIRRNYKTPNPFILKDLGASNELIAYLRYTPENTNFNMVDSITNPGGGETDTVTISVIADSRSFVAYATSVFDEIAYEIKPGESGEIPKGKLLYFLSTVVMTDVDTDEEILSGNPSQSYTFTKNMTVSVGEAQE